MNYGLYLSATGVLASSYRQDVIANNLANAETVGFKRDLALLQQRNTEAQERHLNPAQRSNPLLEGLGGGLFPSSTGIDTTAGDSEETGTPSDVSIHGDGFFGVMDRGQVRLTRNGQFILNRQGQLVLSAGGQQLLDTKQKPITLEAGRGFAIGDDGTITQGGQPVAKLGVFAVPDASKLRKQGMNLLAYSDPKALKPSDSTLRIGWLERSNVEPATELTLLMDAQRQLEANANMIRYQDQMLGRLVNDVGKIG